MNHQLINRLAIALFAVLLLVAGILFAAEGERPNVNFNHDQTTFSLSGMHTNTACESCHVKGIFKGTPSTCGGCHSRGGAVIAQMKPATHIPANQDCGTCHRPQGWLPTIFKHSMVTQQTCSSCHNGTNETGKPANHIQTSKDCGECHKTTSWLGGGLDHSALVPPATSRCSDCHGKTATGKPTNHIYTTSQCDTCHKSTTAWLPASFDHAAINPVVGGRCNDCHLNGNATHRTTNHIQTGTQQCDTCHTYVAWTPTHFDHASLTPAANGRCSTCHNGISAKGLSSAPRHIPVGGQQCDSCHSTIGWVPTSFDHSQVSSANGCTTCHNGVNASGKKTNHLKTIQQCDLCHATNAWTPSVFAHTTQQLGGQTCNQCHNGTVATGRPLTGAKAHTVAPMTNNCDACHTPSAWTPATMNHSGATNCASCHNISAAGSSWTPAKVNHISTAGHAQCSDCHTTSLWKPSTFNHQGITSATSCTQSGCHDTPNAAVPNAGRPLSGAKAHTLAPMTSATCGSCHTVGGTWSPAKMNHTGATTCSACHATAGNTFTPAKLNHISTVGYAQCSSCHSTTGWLPTSFSHVGVTPSTDCTTCHNGTTATGKPQGGIRAHTTAPMTNNTCGSCHAIGSAWLPATMNHTGATGCTNCHAVSATATNWTPAKVNHITTSGHTQCADCHTTAVWNPSTFKHQNITTATDCTTCHNNTNAPGRPTGVKAHIVAPMTANTCASCHTIGTVWTPTPMNHTGATNCTSCHAYTGNGFTPAKVGHISTTSQCSTCHATSAWLPAKAFDHAANGVTSATNCAQSGCHDTANATIPKAGRPITGTKAHSQAPMTGNTCGSCHTIGTVWTPATMDHTSLSTCKQCHAYTGNGFTPTKATHINTALECINCHTKTAWLPTTFNHAGSGVIATTDCTTCHNGTSATGRPTTGTKAHTQAPLTSNTCGSCHNIGGGWTPATMNHVGLTSCTTCHATAGNGFTPAKANHIATTGYAQCSSCHTTSGWLPTSFNHTGVTAATDCSTCHNGTSATGRPATGTKAHTLAPLTNNTCGSCHTIGTAWTPATMNHNGLTSCTSCHSYAGNGFTPTKVAHINTPSQCSSCHLTTAWLPASGINHSTFTSATDCTQSGCHNGTTATGRPASGTKAHIYAPMTSINCGTCHTIGTVWTPATMNHTNATTCTNCHATAGNGFTPAKANHIPTTGFPQCSSCHTTTAWPTTFNHSAKGVTTATDCTTCHNGLSATGRPSGVKAHAVAPMTANTCGSCHTLGGAWTPTPMNHSGTTNCSACHAYTGNGFTPVKVGHVNTTSQCSICHATSAWLPAKAFDHSAAGITSATNCTQSGCHDTPNAVTPKAGRPISGTKAHTQVPMTNVTCGSCHSIGTLWTPATMNHTGAISCASCHSTPTGNGFTPTKSTHITTVGHAQCSDCHTTSVWAPSTFNHQSVTSASDCYTGCHNGTNVATTRPTGALAHTQAPMTSNNCGSCHTIGSAWAPGTMNHTGVTTCTNCHAYTGNGFTPMKANHIVTASQCNICHTTAAWLPTSFAHTSAQTTGKTCKDCHNGTAAVGPVASHTGISPTPYNCDSCHRTTAWTPATFAHSGVTSGCTNCHKAGFATTQSATHFITSQSCEKCHTTSAWSPIKSYVHLSTAYKTHTGPNMTVYADCLLCHINKNEVITGAPHRGNAAYKPDCAWCHATQFKAGPHTKTNSPSTVLYTVAELKNCNGACHIYTNNTFTVVKTNRTGQHRATDGGF